MAAFLFSIKIGEYISMAVGARIFLESLVLTCAHCRDADSIK
jgi:hypothetical protein